MANLGTAVNTAVSLGAVAVSNSYGGGESSSDLTYDSSYYHHPGVAIVASTGDDGYGVEYPAASQYVVAVGGTSLARASNPRGWTEAAWSGAGSGCSGYDAKPAWQTDAGCARRTVADVSAVADPNTGVAVYDASAGGWSVFGGTSVSSPIIASMYALAGNPGSYPAGLLYSHTGNLNDVTAGSNGSCGASGSSTYYLCNAVMGYDGPTGLGTPNGIAAFMGWQVSLGASATNVTVGTPVTLTATAGQIVGPGVYTLAILSGGSVVKDCTSGTTCSTTVTSSAAASQTYTAAVALSNGTLPLATSSAVTVTWAPTLAVTGIANPSVAGASDSVTVTAQNQGGATDAAYRGTIAFTSTDPKSTLPASYTFTAGDAGTHTFGPPAVVLRTAGTQSVTATDTANSLTTGTQSGIVVTPAPATTLVVSGIANPSVAGAWDSVTVTAQDPYGNTDSGYLGTVAFTSTDAQATLPAAYAFTAGDAGVHTFATYSCGSGSPTLCPALVLRTAGTQAVTATDTVHTGISGAQSAIVVNAGAAATLTVSGLPSPDVAGVAHNATVTALDAYGNTATGYTGTVHLTSSDPLATLSGDATLSHGVGTFSVTLETVGSQSVTATDTGTSSITGAQSGISVITVPGQPTGVSATTPGYLSALVSWIAPADNGGSTITGYTVTSSPDGKTCTTGGALSCTVSNLTYGKAYTFTVTATNAAGTGPASVASSQIMPTSPPTQIAINAGNGQSATVGTAVSIAPSVIVKDAYGNAVSGVAVTFAIGSGGGSLSGGSTTTNSSGIATVGSWTLGQTAGSNTLTATSAGLTGSPVTFSATATPGASTKYLVTSSGYGPIAGTAVTIGAQLADTYGNPVSTSGLVVTWSKTGSGGSFATGTSTTNAAGLATVSFTTGTTAGTTYTVTATDTSSRTGTSGPITTVAGAATQIAVNAGNGQSATVGTAVSIAPSVIVKDANGNAVSGVSVTFAIGSGGGSLSGGSTTTNSSGIATVGSWTLGQTAGSNTLTATSTGLTGSPVTFTATGTAGTPTQIAVNAGNGQSATVGTAVSIAPSVIVKDAYGNAVSGVAVTFAIGSGGGSLSGGSTTTNSSGIATVGSWTLGQTAGSNTLTATSTGLTGSPVTFTATGTAGTPTQIAVNAGNGQSATVGTAVSIAPSVIVKDAYGNAVSGVSVTFAIGSGGGSLSGGSTTTNSSGIATVGSWTLGQTAGSNTLTATSAGLTGSPVTFSATGTAGAATKYLVTSSGYGPIAGTAVTIGAQLTDTYGNPVSTSGLVVTWSKSGSGGSFATGTSTTNAAGLATVSFTTGTTAGTTYTVTATDTSSRTGTSGPIIAVAGALDHLVLSPSTATVNPGIAQAFTAEGFDAYGNDLFDVTSATTFTIAGGTCTANSCTSTVAGDHTVTGTDGTAIGTAKLTITGVQGVVSGATYHAISPTRALDTRNGTGGLSGPFTNHAARTFTVAGVPSNATAVTGNLTVTGQTSSGYLYIGPVAANNPTSSTLNFPVGDDRANAVTVQLGAGSTLAITFVAPGNGPTAHAIFDVTGYFTPDTSGATYHAIAPTRALDTRSGTGGLSGPFTNHAARTFTVAGVPAGATAVTGNLTVTGQTSSGYLYIGPVATNNPTSSTLNFPLGDDRANAVTVQLGSSNTLSITFVAPSNGPTAQAIFDVTGYFTAGHSAGPLYVPLSPEPRPRHPLGTGGLAGPFTNHAARTFALAASLRLRQP